MSEFKLSTLVAASLVGLTGVAHADDVDVTNSNGTISNQFLSSNGGLDSTNFTSDTDGNISVFLRARNRGDNGADIVSTGSNYYLRLFEGASADRYSIDFQLTPAAGAGAPDYDYNVRLKIDTDPSAAQNFTIDYAEAIFGGGALWVPSGAIVEDGISVRGGNTVAFTPTTGIPSYVLSQSWALDFGFLIGSNPGAGQYDIMFSAEGINGTITEGESASAMISVFVAPTPTAALAGLLGLGAVAMPRRA